MNSYHDRSKLQSREDSHLRRTLRQIVTDYSTRLLAAMRHGKGKEIRLPFIESRRESKGGRLHGCKFKRESRREGNLKWEHLTRGGAGTTRSLVVQTKEGGGTAP